MRVLLLGGDGEYTDIVYHKISQSYDVIAAIVEDPVPKKQLIKRRIKTLGMAKVLGQVLFQILIIPVLKARASKRIEEIKKLNKMNDSRDYRMRPDFYHIHSINSDETIKLLKEYKPDVVIVNGTRIISKRILKSSDAIFINMHMGITPKYRGVHGGYWALYENDAKNAGVTIHLVDEGIDTGEVLYQSCIRCNEWDNFCTYPYLQLAEGIKLEMKVLEDIEKNELKSIKVNLPSMLWSHPTIREYLHARRKRNVR